MELLGIRPTQARLALRRGACDEAEAALAAMLALCRAMPFPCGEANALYIYGLLHVRKGESGRLTSVWRRHSGSSSGWASDATLSTSSR